MKRIVYTFAFLLSLLSAHAQSHITQEEMQTLVQRVDSLEHELSYLKLSNQLKELDYDITTFKNEVDIKYIEIHFNFHTRNIGSRLDNLYKTGYEISLQKMRTISVRIEVVKALFAVETTKPYSEMELNTLNSLYRSIDTEYNLLERSMDLLKVAIDMYNEGVQVLSEK